MIKAVIFDLDGTLLNTLEDLANSMNSVLDRRGFPTHPIDAYKLFVGDGIRVMSSRCLPDHLRSESLIDAVVIEMEAEYTASWHIETKPYPEIPDLLAEIRAGGLASAVLSNKPDVFTVRMVEWFFPDHPFTAVRGASDGKPRKPDPTLALEIAGQMSVEPDEVCFLGDTRTDMETAVRAGFLPIGAFWGFRTEKELIASGASVVIRSPRTLIDYLEKLKR